MNSNLLTCENTKGRRQDKDKTQRGIKGLKKGTGIYITKSLWKNSPYYYVKMYFEWDFNAAYLSIFLTECYL